MPAAIHRPACNDARLLATTVTAKGEIKLFGEGLVAIATEAIASGATGNWSIPFGVQHNITMHTTGFTGVIGDFCYLLAAGDVGTTLSTSNVRMGIFLSAPAGSGANAIVLMTPPA